MLLIRSDDEVIGVGGTITKYVKEGKDIIVVIFSFGEASDPIVKSKVVKNQRIKEANEVGAFLGVKETIFLGVTDGKISKRINDEEFLLKIVNIINKYKPEKIFTHGKDDPHKDHSSVNKIVNKSLDKIKKEYSLYAFDVHNQLNLFRKNQPRMYVDISETFDKKLKALELFKTQQIFIRPLLPHIIISAKVNGVAYDCKYAERFFKVR